MKSDSVFIVSTASYVKHFSLNSELPLLVTGVYILMHFIVMLELASTITKKTYLPHVYNSKSVDYQNDS